MLLQKSRTVLRSVSGLPLPFKPAQYGLCLGPLRHQIHVRKCSAAVIIPFPHLGVSRGPSFRVITRFHINSSRLLSTTHVLRKDVQPKEPEIKADASKATDEALLEYKRTEKGEAAKAVDLSARLKDRSSQNEKGEVIRLLKLAGREWRALGVAILLLCISSGVSMSIPFSIGKIIDIATSKTPINDLFGLSLPKFYMALGVILCVGSACNFGRITLLRIVGERTAALLRSRLYEKTIRQDATFYDSNRHGELISRLSNDTTIAAKSITQNVSDGLRAIVSGIAGFGMMAYVCLPLTGLMLIIVPPLGILGVFYGRYVRKLSKRTQRALGELTKVSEERLGNVRTAQAFNGEIQEVHRYNKKIRDLFDLGKKEGLANAFFFSGYSLAGNATVLMVLAIGGQMVSSGSISIGDLSSFLLYTIYAGSSISGLSSFYSELMKGVGAASRIFELLDREPSIKTTVGTPISNARGVIKFEHVQFAYPTRPLVKIFKDLSFEVEPGTNVSIVGPSGGGKSTISSLLLRFYDPTSGRITLNGVDIREYSAKQFRRHISVVPQEPVLFSGTLAENIAYGDPRATQQQILAAARRANCDFIGDFPDGLETEVGPRGAQLSGGQKQRIAIARALIRNPDILILDEATSALDANSEFLVNDALQKVMRSDSTTLTIAHRLATIRRADWIIVLSSEGEVAEQGTYSQLSRKPNGAFNTLMQMQMEGFTPPEPQDGVIYEEAEKEEKAEQEMKEEEEARLEEERDLAEQREKGETI